MAILKFKDENGNVQEILALRGPKGERGVDAYEKVREYGYDGTEEEFYLAMGQNGTVPDTTLTKDGVAADAHAVGLRLDASVPKTYTAPVTTNWVESEGEFYQEVSVPGILETDEPFPDIVPGNDRSTTKEYRKAFEAVTDIETHADHVRVWAERAIEIPFSIRLKVVR